MCNHELKRLFYTSDDDYGIQTCSVELEENDEKHTLSYCEKCGQVFVMEIAEKDKIRVGDEMKITEGGSLCVVCGIVSGTANLIFENGSLGQFPVDKLIRTGRHFDAVEKLLEEMRSES